MAKFSDLNIEKLTGKQIKSRDSRSEYYRGYFDNGYGVSIVLGYHDGLFELAVLKKVNGEKSHKLCYDTAITPDVIGSLTEEEACDIAVLVRGLPSHVN